MVNNKSRTPHYDLAQIKAYVQQSQFELVTRGARKGYKELAWSSRELIAVVQSLHESRHFHKTLDDMATDIGFITVDAYRINFDDRTLKEDSINGPEYYLKLAIDPDKPGTAVVSLHLSR